MSENNIPPEHLIEACGKFCQVLTRDEVELFLRFSTIKNLEPREIIAEIGEIGDAFFLVMQGEVRLFQQEGLTEIEVGRIQAGGLVGEMSFFDKRPRTVRLKAGKQATQLIVITRPMYRRLTIEHPFIAVNLLEFIILSLDHLVRSTSKDISFMHKTMTGVGYR